MEQKRRIYANENLVCISKLEKYIERDSEILKGISKLQIPVEVKKQKTEELETLISERMEEIEKLKVKQTEIEKGRCDEEIVGNIKKNVKVEKVPIKPILSKPKQKYEVNIHSMTSQHREDKYKQKDYDYFYRHFQKCQETLPNYIQENLKEMPNNKGYIWRGCWFFGDLQNEPNQPLILFEKNRGIMNIHEVDDNEHRIFQKIGKNKKTLIQRIPKHNYNKKKKGT